jgi:hypothetical protein
MFGACLSPAGGVFAERLGPQIPNAPPVFFVLEPIEGEVYPAGVDIFFMAETRDEDGFTVKVEFFADDLKIGEVFLDTNPPPDQGLPIAVDFFWIDPPPGVHQVRLEATDNMGGIGVSDLINLTVLQPESPPVPEVFVTRNLPEAFQPGTWFRVILEIHPEPGMTTYAIEDNPPPGWVAGEISHNGVYDVHTGKVKFGPFLDTEPRELRYDVLPPADAENVDCFIGSASADGLLFPIEGDDCIHGAPLLHPADLHPPESVITIEEVTGYGSAWRRGEDWLNPPNPIPIDYVTRAAALWKGGEYYELNLSEGEPPMCWVNAVPVAGLMLAPHEGAGIVAPVLASTAFRRLPELYVPGMPMILQVEVVSAAQVGGYAVEISCPADADVTEISDGGNWDADARVIRWGPFMDAQSRNLTCRVTPSARAGQPIIFAGAFSVDGIDAPLEGAMMVQPGACIKGLSWSDREGMIIDIGGVQERDYIIEVSSDMRQWAILGAVTAVDGEARLIDEQAGQFHHRFYRIQDVAGE